MKPRQLWIIMFFFILGVMGIIQFKISPYNHSLSALIGLWEGFYEINPNLVDPNFVVYKSGGYDGQFFYLLAKDLFNDSDWNLIVDSYYFRYHRIGLSLISGYVSHLLGSEHYPIITLAILFSTFLFSVYCLYQLLPEKSKWLVLFYILSPYSLNSNLLLVADSFFVSLAIISYYFYTKNNLGLSFLFFLITVFTRELGVLFLAPIVLGAMYHKRWKEVILFSLPGILFLGFLYFGWKNSPNHLGTNPLGFKDMTDVPLFGFVKSFFDHNQFQFKLKEFPKLLFLVSFLSMIMISISSIRNSFQKDLNLLVPILGSLFVITIAEEGYWRSFDNLSRMFTLILPFSLLLEGVNKKLSFKIFLSTSLTLFFFLLIRIFFITPTKEYFLAL
ncbi:AZOBR_p60025 family cell surface glycopolymer formation protein [Leptospira sp.]|uniref:AZOBR_p60025 family cell surface glycopolymer formation protein n=1 Tax=Leptospira sp. TaxID=178 RepID=UPI00345A28EE